MLWLLSHIYVLVYTIWHHVCIISIIPSCMRKKGVKLQLWCIEIYKVINPLKTNMSSLVQVLAWHRIDDKPLPKQCWSCFMTPYSVNRPQWSLVCFSYYRQFSVDSRDSITKPSINVVTLATHDDVIKWKHFPHNWPFVRGIRRSRWIPHTKASDAELWCFLWSASE